MRWCKLHPDDVIARSEHGGLPASPPTCGRSLTIGALGMLLVALAIFGLWAVAGRGMWETMGEGGMYALWTLIGLGGGGLAMAPLAIGRGSKVRFGLVFMLAFLVYAIVWMASWFTLPNKLGEVLGATIGPAAMAAVFCAAFGSWRPLLAAAVVLIVGNAAGYFVGDIVWRELRDTRADLSKILWGVSYGIGFGLGIGAAAHLCQAEIRRRLRLK